MLRGWQFWLLNGLLGFAICLWGLNTWLGNANAALQATANENQVFLNQTTRLAQLNQQLARSLAAAAVETGDEEIKALLAANAISYSFTPNEPALKP